jgi:hypothetical protein
MPTLQSESSTHPRQHVRAGVAHARIIRCFDARGDLAPDAVAVGDDLTALNRTC